MELTDKTINHNSWTILWQIIYSMIISNNSSVWLNIKKGFNQIYYNKICMTKNNCTNDFNNIV